MKHKKSAMANVTRDDLQSRMQSANTVFQAMRSRQPGPRIGMLNKTPIYEYIQGEDGERWHFDGGMYPGRKLADSDILLKNAAVYALAG